MADRRSIFVLDDERSADAIGGLVDFDDRTLAPLRNINGTEGDDRIEGTARDDLIRGRGGDDDIDGLGGDDELFGNQGSDSISGGSGDDRLRGGTEGDDLRGGGGVDRINGNSGGDTIRGGSGRDTIRGGGDDDDLRGGAGRDFILGGSGDDVLRGETGEDILDGRTGANTLQGGANGDTFLYDRVDGARDLILDFDPVADVIDIAGIFEGEVGDLLDAPLDFLDMRPSGTGVVLAVDPDGGGDHVDLVRARNVDVDELTAGQLGLADVALEDAVLAAIDGDVDPVPQPDPGPDPGIAPPPPTLPVLAAGADTDGTTEAPVS